MKNTIAICAVCYKKSERHDKCYVCGVAICLGCAVDAINVCNEHRPGDSTGVRDADDGVEA